MKKILLMSLICASALHAYDQGATERSWDELVGIGMNPNPNGDPVYKYGTGNACMLNGYASEQKYYKWTFKDARCPYVLKELSYNGKPKLHVVNGVNTYEYAKEGDKIWINLTATSIYMNNDFIPSMLSSYSVFDGKVNQDGVDFDKIFGTSYLGASYLNFNPENHTKAKIYKLSADSSGLIYPFSLHAAYVKNGETFKENTEYIKAYSELTQEVDSDYGTKGKKMNNEKGAFMLIDTDTSWSNYDVGYKPWISVPLEYAKCKQDVVYQIALSNDLWINSAESKKVKTQMKYSTNVLYYYQGQLRERNFTNEDARHIMMRNTQLYYYIYVPGEVGGQDCTQELKAPEASFQTMYVDITDPNNKNLSVNINAAVEESKFLKEIRKSEIRSDKAEEQFQKRVAQDKALKGTKKLHKAAAKNDEDLGKSYYNDLKTLQQDAATFLKYSKPAEDILLRIDEVDDYNYIKMSVEAIDSDYISVKLPATASTTEPGTLTVMDSKGAAIKQAPIPKGLNLESGATLYSAKDFEVENGKKVAYLQFVKMTLPTAPDPEIGKFVVNHHRKTGEKYIATELKHAPLALRTVDLFQGKFNAKAKQFYVYYSAKELKIDSKGKVTMHDDGLYRISDTSIQVEFEDTNYYFTQSQKGCYDKDLVGKDCDYANPNPYPNALNPENPNIQTFPFAVKYASFRAKDMTMYEYYKKYYAKTLHNDEHYFDDPKLKQELDSLVSRHCRLDDNTNMFESNVMDENGKVACHASASQYFTFDKVKNCAGSKSSRGLDINDKTNSIVANSDLGMFLNASGEAKICISRKELCESVFSSSGPSCKLPNKDEFELLSEFDNGSELDFVLFADNKGEVEKFSYNDKKLVEYKDAVWGTTNDGRGYVFAKIVVDEDTLNTPLRKALDHLCDNHHCTKTNIGDEYEVRDLVHPQWNPATDNTTAMLQKKVLDGKIPAYTIDGLQHSNTISGGGEVLGYDDKLQFPQFNVDMHACKTGSVDNPSAFFATKSAGVTALDPTNPSTFNGNKDCSSIYNVPVVKSFIKFDDQSVPGNIATYIADDTRLKYFDRDNALASYDYERDSGTKCTQNGPITYCKDNEADCKKGIKASGNQPTKPCYNNVSSKGSPGFENLTKLKSAYGNETNFANDTWTITNGSKASYTKDQITCYGGKFECLDFSVEFNKQQAK